MVPTSLEHADENVEFSSVVDADTNCSDLSPEEVVCSATHY